MTTLDIIGLCLLVSAPFLGVRVAIGLYNAYVISRHREILAADDEFHEREFDLWWEGVNAHHGLVPAFCPIKIEPGETCYSHVDEVTVFEPCGPVREGASADAIGVAVPDDPELLAVQEDPSERPVFDVECGVSVGRGWSVKELFGGVRLVGHCKLCVTDCRLFVRSLLHNIDVPLYEITRVTASCSDILIEASSLPQPLVLGGLNGQKLRDILHLLMDDPETYAWKRVSAAGPQQL